MWKAAVLMVASAAEGRRREGIWRRGLPSPPRAGCAQRTEIAAPALAPPAGAALAAAAAAAAGGGRREARRGARVPPRRPCRRRGPITGLHTPDGELTTSQDSSSP